MAYASSIMESPASFQDEFIASITSAYENQLEQLETKNRQLEKDLQSARNKIEELERIVELHQNSYKELESSLANVQNVNCQLLEEKQDSFQIFDDIFEGGKIELGNLEKQYQELLNQMLISQNDNIVKWKSEFSEFVVEQEEVGGAGIRGLNSMNLWQQFNGLSDQIKACMIVGISTVVVVFSVGSTKLLAWAWPLLLKFAKDNAHNIPGWIGGIQLFLRSQPCQLMIAKLQNNEEINWALVKGFGLEFFRTCLYLAPTLLKLVAK